MALWIMIHVPCARFMTAMFFLTRLSVGLLSTEMTQGGSYELFKNTIRFCSSACTDAGNNTRYTSTLRYRILYDSARVTVNGKDFPLHGYQLYDSPYMNADWGSRVIRIVKGEKSLSLDFRDQSNPIRVENPGKKSH